MRKLIYIFIIALCGVMFAVKLSCPPVCEAEDNIVVSVADHGFAGHHDVYRFLFSDYDDSRAEMLAADVSHLGSLVLNFRIMVRLAARQIYNTSVLWSKYAVRMIAEYIQHQSFINECLNSSKFRVGMTGSHVSYLYQLCRIVI